jgi:hypothetical protein
MLQATGRKITAESLKQITHELEPRFTGLSFQVIRRNPRAYTLYREAADAFTAATVSNKQTRRRRRQTTRRATARTARSSYDPLQRLDKRDLIRRIRELQNELEIERQRRGALAYDQQAMQARILRLETELVLVEAEGHMKGQ